MIIIVSHDDNQLINLAQQQSGAHPNIFGHCYQAFHGPIPQLGVQENVFITAHGAYGTGAHNAVIGDHTEAHEYDGITLYSNIQGIFPNNYAGSVYISACDSARSARGGLNFASVFLSQLRLHHTNARVFGHTTAVGLAIIPPNHTGWKQVTI